MIAPKLRLLLNTKKDLQAILKVPNGVPFNQYVRYLAWVGEPIPKAHLFGDYVKGRFTAGGKAVLQDEVGEFTRLSKATNFVGGELVEYEVGEARVEAGKGLLIEPQRTNYSTRSSWVTMNGATVEPSPRELLFSGQSAIRVALSNNRESRVERSAIVFTTLARPVTASSYVISEEEGYVHYGFGSLDSLSTHPVGNTWSRAVSVVQAGVVTSSYEKYLALYPDKSITYDATCNQLEANTTKPSSFIPTSGTPVTRAPDLLRIPLLPHQSITIDADEGLRCVKDGASALISADTPAYLRTFAVDEAKVAFNNYATGVYKVDDMEVSFEQLNEFTRLTSATNFVGGELVEYAANKPRIETGKGLLIEPESTNFIPTNTDLNSNQFSYGERPVPSVGGGFYRYSGVLSNSVGYSAAHLIEASFSIAIRDQENRTLLATYRAGGGGYALSLSVEGISSVPVQLNPYNKKVITSGNVRRLGFTRPAATALDPIYTHSTIQVGGSPMSIGYPQIESAGMVTSVILTGASPVTRSPDLLRLTIPAGKTLTLDADDGISYVMENATTALITATKPAYIRSARIA